jgi:uncharacterized membrane protein
MSRLLTGIRKSFLAGLFLVLPAAVTLYLLYLGFQLFADLSRPVVEKASALLGFSFHPALAALLSILLTTVLLVLLGFAGRSYLGSRLMRLFDAVALKIPLAKTLYSATRRLVDSVSAQASFQKVVLVQFPREGSWSMGFCTGDARPVMGSESGEYVNVFLPTTPNPTSGYLLMLPRSEVRFLDLTVEEGLTFVLSGGIATPGGAAPGGLA